MGVFPLPSVEAGSEPRPLCLTFPISGSRLALLTPVARGTMYIQAECPSCAAQWAGYVLLHMPGASWETQATRGRRALTKWGQALFKLRLSGAVLLIAAGTGSQNAAAKVQKFKVNAPQLLFWFLPIQGRFPQANDW